MSNEVNPAYSDVFQSDIVATYAAKQNTIKPLGLRIKRNLDQLGFYHHVIAPYKIMKLHHGYISYQVFALSYILPR